MTRPRNSENGSIFFIILLAVVMFGMLSYAVSQGSRSSAAALTREQARSAAQEIISYGNAIQKGVATLRLRGCSDTQLDFTNGGKSMRGNGNAYDYTNPNSPDDDSCDVFSINGGKVTPQLLSSGYVDSASISPAFMDVRSFVVTATRMAGLGEDSGAGGTDLIIWIGRLRPEVCMAVSDLLDVDNPGTPPEPPIDDFDCDGTIFNGAYTSCANAVGDIPELTGKSAYCSGYDDSGPMYNYFQVLVVR
jgi:hypothetical protein